MCVHKLCAQLILISQLILKALEVFNFFIVYQNYRLNSLEASKHINSVVCMTLMILININSYQS